MTTVHKQEPIPWKWLSVIMLIAVAVRLVIWISDPFSNEPVKDSMQYHTLAVNLVDHGSYSLRNEAPFKPSGRRPPGYPGMMSLVYSVFGPQPRLVKLVQIAFGPLLCLLVFAIAMRAFRNSKVAMLAAGWVALSPPLIEYNNHLDTSCLFTLALVSSVFGVYQIMETRRFSWGLVTGISWSVLSLVKPEAVLLPVVIASVAMCVLKARRQPSSPVIVALMISMVCVGSWVVRNRVVMGRFALVTTQTKDETKSYGMLHSYRVMAEHGFYCKPDRVSYFIKDAESESKRYYELEAKWRAEGHPVKDPSESDVMFWLKRPVMYSKYCGVRFFLLLRPTTWSRSFRLDAGFDDYIEEEQYVRLMVKAGLLLLDGLTLAVGGLGLLMSLRYRWRDAWMMVLTVVYFVGVYTALHATFRYRVPLMPFVSLFAAWMGVVLWEKMRFLESTSLRLSRRNG